MTKRNHVIDLSSSEADAGLKPIGSLGSDVQIACIEHTGGGKVTCLPFGGR
jgi:hypothetical protein